jgi:hypothetical protein
MNPAHEADAPRSHNRMTKVSLISRPGPCGMQVAPWSAGGLMSRASQRGSSVGAILSSLTFVMLMASVCLNLLQASRLRAFTDARLSGLPIGSAAPSLSVTTLSGEPIEISFAGNPTILYYFSPKCVWCERNWLNLKALSAAVAGRYRVVGLSTSADVTTYATDRGLPFEIYAGLTPEVTRAYHFGGTPHTVLISGTGRVERSWAGAYTPRVQREIEATFGIVLPGLQSPVATR